MGRAFSAERQPEGALPYLKEGKKGISYAGSHPEGKLPPPEVTQRGTSAGSYPEGELSALKWVGRGK